MECVKDPNLYEECKKVVKTWECNFIKKKGRQPSKFDIREADKHVRHAYYMYFKLKTAALEQSLSDIFRDDDDNESHNVSNNQFEEPQEEKQVVEEELPIQEEAKSDPKPEIKNDVWGEHLNNKVVEEKKTKKIELKNEKPNSAITQKLFKNAKFVKRNPRKSFQLNRSSSSLNSSISLSQPITASQCEEIENADISADISLSSFNSTLPIASDTRQISSQSVNIITQLLESRNNSMRHVDKGWLERVSSNTGTELLDDSNVPVNKEIFEIQPPKQQNVNTFDSDDVISDSDEEIHNNLHPSKRIKLSTTINSSNLNISTPQINIENKSEILTSKIEEPKVIEPKIKDPEVVNIPNQIEAEINNENEKSDDEEIIPKKSRKNIKNISSDSDSDDSKPLLKRKRNARKSAPKEKTKTKRASSSKTKKEIDEIPTKTDEYEMEYSIKPPPPTVPRVNIKNILVESKIDVEENTFKNAPSQTQEKLKKQMAKEKLMKKIESGSLNDNFIRLDIKKKVYVRGKKHMNFSKYKKSMYKKKKKALYGPDMDMGGCDGGELTCYKCGKTGHFARQCKLQSDKLLPLDAAEEEKSDLPSLEEASKMARDSALAIHAPNQVFAGIESAIKSLNTPEIQNGNQETTNKDIDKENLEETSDDDEEEEENKDLEYEFDDDDLEEFMKNADIEKEIIESENKITNEMSQKWLELLEENCVKPIYELNEDGSLPETPKEVFDALKKFGHTSFRAGQEQAVMRILCGQSTLVTLSTGSGKSLCYQLPAYIYAKRKNCVTLVISPLVSLMEDQVAGIPSFFNAACLHTNQTATQKEKVLKLIDSGLLNILLVSPEAVTSGEKKSGFGSLLRKLPPIAFACIDEAHCVSQWSHNFRPSYLVICRVLRERLGIQTILGLTATSTHATSSSIVEHLKIPDGHNGVICDIPLPDNLYLSVSSDMQRDAALKNLLSADPFDAFDSIIIYCTRREECERIASHLRTGLRTKSSEQPIKKYKSLSQIAEAYHAGLPASKRRTVQNAFMSGYVRIVVATVAFGMGINKANIRGVIHYNMPRNFESYVQEVGRAGRDGLPAHCHLFLDSEGRDQNELRRHIYANSMDRHVIRKLLRKIFVPCDCKNSCPRHEVAFSIESTVKELDVPEENISTLLCYLELHERRYLEVLTPVYIHCKIISYGSPQNIIRAAKDCPPLAMALALQKLDSLKENVFEFPVVDVASAMGWDSGIVKSKLKNLEWVTENNAPKRSTLTVEFSNLGFHLRAPGNLPPSELDDALDTLFAKKKEQETTSLLQLQVVYNTLTAVTEKFYHLCLTDEYKLKSEKLKKQIRDYFSCEQPLKDVQLTNKCVANEQQIIADVRCLVAMYRDNNFTGRAAARIFHGIQSPNYPAVMWGRCKFWRAHLNSDFNQVYQICTAEILKLR